MVMAMKELVDLVEKDLREVVEWEMIRFRDRYPECMKVDSIYINEDFGVGVYDIQIHGLVCNHHLNIFVTREALYEFPEFRCWVVFEDTEFGFRRELAHILLFYTPLNKCYVKTELNETELRETAEHIVRVAARIAAEEAERG
jgi:hypothetical protein